jgi:hypothetical protein
MRCPVIPTYDTKVEEVPSENNKNATNKMQHWDNVPIFETKKFEKMSYVYIPNSPHIWLEARDDLETATTLFFIPFRFKLKNSKFQPPFLTFIFFQPNQTK